MWEEQGEYFKNKCTDCRWCATTACPLEVNYVGRILFDRELQKINQICHRFVLREDVKLKRWQQVHDKLHENLNIDNDNIPF